MIKKLNLMMKFICYALKKVIAKLRILVSDQKKSSSSSLWKSS